MTMKNYLLACLFLSSSVLAQNKFSVSGNPGISLYNFENSLKTIGDKSVGWFPGISIAYDREDLWGLNFHVEYNYNHSRTANVLQFYRTLSSGPSPVESNGADLVLSCHNIDLALCYKLDQWYSIAVGPTVSFVSRSLEINGLKGTEGPPIDFVDRLASLCLGFNGYVNMEIPFSDGPEYPFFFSSLKVRYLHSVWFDRQGRNLDNYHQSFLVGQLNLGFGYNF